MAPAELSPAAAPVTQLSKAAKPDEAATSAQAAWLRFVDEVERGERIDPVGQYVAKATWVGANAQGSRLARPKVDVALRDTRNGYSLRTGQQARTGAATDVIEEPCVIQYTDPCAPCYEGPGGCGGGGGLYSTFTTSENQGGSGYIRDLKLINDVNSPSRVRVTSSGYTMLDADLNKGAGGAYIYLCFQRDQNNVLNGAEYYYNQPYSSPSDFLTNFQTQNGSLTNKPQANTYFFDIWLPNQNPYPFWATQDLNAGADGDYIYSYQSKTPIVNNPAGGTTLWPAFAEIGILSGNSSTITPPAGWTKYPKDLNEGAGGDYIYFCYR
ncbi:hypothetical protein ACFST9_23930 [Hymenobacter monticola]|uniref:MABP domain-containing protein n=1 Tax=Hymenobacter monticola TaxID=1705399 RepID=A0ABY4B769_9BACT|nr:hypothetical protein [Hymenobacter monticola]UOE33851.1 hypothetical protein MTP16_22395 [Hymenobacter monticola]